MSIGSRSAAYRRSPIAAPSHKKVHQIHILSHLKKARYLMESFALSSSISMMNSAIPLSSREA